jgi:hypothetical protein
MPEGGAHFTCFTGTKVQKLTLERLGGGACEYLVRTVTRALLELQGAIEAEQDLEKCEESIGMMNEAAMRE